MDPDEDEVLESEAKRRRLRKGTHSCWACKRRKVRCTFGSLTDATCITCRRRGIKCISQELPEDIDTVENSTERIVRVEALLNQLAQKVDHSAANDGDQLVTNGGRMLQRAAPTPNSDCESSPSILPHGPTQKSLRKGDEVAHARTQYSTPALRTPVSQTHTPARAAPPDIGTSKYEKILQALRAALPPQEDIDILLKFGSRGSMFCHQVNVKSRSQLERDGFREDSNLGDIHSSHAHPVLLAKKMLIFASELLHLSPHEQLPDLSEPHRVIMERIADTAINLVTTNEELYGTMESLECILIEAFYHLNCGNIRRSWLAFRRGIGAAQLMGINRTGVSSMKVIDSSTKIDPQFMWFRIVYMDRFLSLMLGLSQGNSGVILGSDTAVANGSPNERLERLHAVILARVVERNELGPSERAIAMTLAIDAELLKAAEGLPTKFWGPPNFAGLEKDSEEALWEAMRVKDQIFHYTILNQLHLPFLLCPGSSRKTEYSKITCVNSSREILTRFVAFRTFNRITSFCRLADFLALVAGMTLILAHLYGHRQNETGNLLAHQRLGDRATVEQALENMEVNSKLNEDMLAARCATLLKHLLDIEADAAQGQSYSAEKVQWDTAGYNEDEHNVLFATIPYFGTIRIAREGIRSVDTFRMSPHHTQDLEGNIIIGGIGSVRIATNPVTSDFDQSSANDAVCLIDELESGNPPPPSHLRPTQPQVEGLNPVSEIVQLPSTVFTDDFMMQQDLYPSVAAGMNDWVFQGVDTTFFDNLMRGTSVLTGDVSEIPDWNQALQSDLSRP